MNLLPKTRAGRIRFVILCLAPLALFAILAFLVVDMPGVSYGGTLPRLSADELETQERLRRTVQVLGDEIGERHDRSSDALGAAAAFLEQELASLGCDVERQTYRVGSVEVANLEVAVDGTSPELGCLVVGAHYDTVAGTPGADDNASGVAGLVEMVRLLRGHAFRHDLRFVLYANEEPPRFQTDGMGSLVHARGLQQDGVDVVAMISIESIGYFSFAPGSQEYPAPFSLFYPDRGEFIAFVGDLGSRSLVRRTIRAFREHARFPSEGAAAPAFVPGVGWSDLLAAGLLRGHGYRHRAIPEPELPRAFGHAEYPGFRCHDARGPRVGARDCRARRAGRIAHAEEVRQFGRTRCVTDPVPVLVRSQDRVLGETRVGAAALTQGHAPGIQGGSS